MMAAADQIQGVTVNDTNRAYCGDKVGMTTGRER